MKGASSNAAISVGRLLELRDVAELPLSDKPLAYELLTFIGLCAERGQRGIEGAPHRDVSIIKEATVTCLPLCDAFLNHPNERVRKEAEVIVENCLQMQHGK